MKSIIYIVPYFGKMPRNFQLWLLSCKMNKTINWLVITDDKTEYDYPENVIVKYDTFDNLKNKIQSKFDFDIVLDRPWKMCDYKCAYGEIFYDDIKKYDYWGHCDIDLIWGNIRKFITDDILEKYDKIGFQGHSTIYRNTLEVNSRYKLEFEDLPSYKEVFSNSKGYCFDEGGMTRIYDRLGIPYYNETNFAHLCKYDYGFYLEHLPKEVDYKNEKHILTWENGNLYRYYIKDNQIMKDEFMYLHFFCRPMTFKMKEYNEYLKYVFYPDIGEILTKDISVKYIISKSKKSKVRYYLKSFWYNRKKITFKRVWQNIQRMIKYKKSRE